MSKRILRRFNAKSMLAAVSLAGVLVPVGGWAEPVATQASAIPELVASHTAVLTGRPPPDEVMHLVVSLPLRNMEQLDKALHDIYNPESPHYRHYLSVMEFRDQFGPKAEDYDSAAAFFSQNGFIVSPATANRYLMDLDGQISDVERVFHVTMGLYQHPTEDRSFISPDRLPAVDLKTPIQEVIGLDDFVRPYHRLVHGVVPGTTGSGPGGNFIGSDIRAAYYPTGMLTGSGQSIGLMELEGVNLADVSAFFAHGYGPANSVHIERIKTDSAAINCNPANCDDTEQALDIEYAISMAPGLRTMRVYIGTNAEDVLNAQASDNISKVLSTSWGWNEHFATDDGLFKEFAMQGQTNLTASGDYSSLAASGPWPEEDANIIAVGGTDLTTTSAGGPWAKETGWSSSAGGPSLDTRIKIESYQLPFINSENGGSKTLRNVPDIAASANTDMEICSNGKCSGGWGGTSFASPIWAGFIALINEQAVANGKPVVGFINPAIYALGQTASYKQGFHDITAGKSGKFRCTPSYDLVTGLGSPTGQALVDLLE